MFLSASVGVGHTSAARAVGNVLRETAVDFEIVDSYEYAASIFARVVADGYIGMVKTFPQLYRFIYARAERASGAGALRTWVSQYTAHNLRELIGRIGPRCVVCTHAFPCGVMSQYKQQIDPGLPVLGIVTDFVVHPFWIYRNVDAYAVATPEIRSALISAGVPSDRVAVTGIPVDPRFGRPRPSAQVRRELGLPADRPIALVMAGGLGIGPIETVLDALARLQRPISAVVLVGRNARRERRLAEWGDRLPFPLAVRGFETNVYDYMHAADVLLTKPGGLTSSEALAARLPMVLVKPLPGQEERNTRYIAGRGAAVRAVSEAGIAEAVERILAAGSPEREGLLRGIEELRRPSAAHDVSALIGMLGSRTMPARVSA